MIIDFRNEQPVSLVEVANFLPKGRNGKPIHAQTIQRWMHEGLRSHVTKQVVKLEFGYIGRMIFTTREAVSRFVAILNGMPYQTNPNANMNASPPNYAMNSLPAGVAPLKPAQVTPAGQTKIRARGFGPALESMLKMSRKQKPGEADQRKTKPRTLKPTVKTA